MPVSSSVTSNRPTTMQETGNNNNQNNILSIRISTDGFSFVAGNRTGEIRFSKPDESFNRTKAICMCEPALQQSFTRVNIYLSNRYSCMLPKIDPRDAGEVLRSSFSSLKEHNGHTFISSNILGYDMINCFAIPAHLHDFLISLYPSCQICHNDSIFAAQALRHSRIGGNRQVWVSIEGNDIAITYCDNGRMQFMNHFELNGDNDALYYIGAIYEQFQLSQKNDFLMICGKCDALEEIGRRIGNCQHKESIYAYN